MSRKYCTGREEHILVTQTGYKVWHDNDLYCAECSKCGAKEDRQLCRRASEVSIACKGED